jgi:hypothetical protein
MCGDSRCREPWQVRLERMIGWWDWTEEGLQLSTPSLGLPPPLQESVLSRIGMSQPPPRAIVFPRIVLIVRTPPPIARFPVCVLLHSVAIVTIPAVDSLLSSMDYCFPPVYCPLLPHVLSYCLYCLRALIVYYLLLSLYLYCSLPSIVLLGLLPSTG